MANKKKILVALFGLLLTAGSVTKAADPTTNAKRAQEYFKSGLELFQEGQCEAAIISLRNGLALDGKNGVAHYYLGTCLMEAGSNADARAEFEAAKRFSPTSKEASLAEVALNHLAATAASAATDPAPLPSNAMISAAGSSPETLSRPTPDLYPPQMYDLLLAKRTAAGTADTPELREAVHIELNTRELLVREAAKTGIDTSTLPRLSPAAPATTPEMVLDAQTAVVKAYVTSWAKAHPISDADLLSEYGKVKATIGDKEYKIAHILVRTEADAKSIIAELQRGGTFASVAQAHSLDAQSREKGGELGWNSPANFVASFAAAVTATPVGKFTSSPVQTPLGWHVIEIEDVRPAKIPSYEEVKSQLVNRLQRQRLDAYFKQLRAANGV